MSKINFDDTARQWHWGVSNAVMYLQNRDGSYQSGVVWNGLTGVTETPTGGEKTTLYADNMVYASFRSEEGLEGTIEAYAYPREFSYCNGKLEVATGAFLGQQSRRAFGFSYRTLVGLNDYILHIIYGVSINPGETVHETISDSPDAVVHSWDYVSRPERIPNYRPVASIQIDSRKVNALKLKALEDILYGTDETDSRLPNLAEVIEIAISLDFRNVLIAAMSTLGLWRWDTFNFVKDTVPIAVERESNLHIYYNQNETSQTLYPSIFFKTLPSEDYEDEDSVNFHKVHYEATTITYESSSSLIDAVAAIPTSELVSSRYESGKYYNVFSIYY